MCICFIAYVLCVLYNYVFYISIVYLFVVQCIVCYFVLLSTNTVQYVCMYFISEYCQLETFHASCPDGQVLYMDGAMYGRMRLGRCVRRDYGSIGCAADVLPHTDRLCSGRRTCSFQVAELNGNQPCPGDLTPYLDLNYTCISSRLYTWACIIEYSNSLLSSKYCIQTFQSLPKCRPNMEYCIDCHTIFSIV